MSEREGVPPAGGAPDRSPADAESTPQNGSGDAPASGYVEPAAPVERPRYPFEPTLPSDLGVRDFERPLDTAELHRLPTGQLLVMHRPELADEASGAVEEDSQRRVYSWIAAVVGTIGAIASLFVGWMLPLSIAALVFGVLGLRREAEGRTLAFVGIGTGIAGLVFSAVWIGYYAIVFGALPS
jgi:hypothetical protein